MMHIPLSLLYFIRKNKTLSFTCFNYVASKFTIGCFCLFAHYVHTCLIFFLFTYVVCEVYYIYVCVSGFLKGIPLGMKIANISTYLNSLCIHLLSYVSLLCPLVSKAFLFTVHLPCHCFMSASILSLLVSQ